MDTLQIQPFPRPPRGNVRVPGSKSLTNRALLIAALAEGQTTLTNALFSDDSRYFAAALRQLGFEVHLDEARQEMRLAGRGGRIPAAEADLFIGNAGTAARFLTAFLTLGQGSYTLDGEPRMRQRPIGDLTAALAELGARIQPLESADAGETICPPLRIQANGLPGGTAHISGRISSQYLSGLLMVTPYAQNPVRLVVEGGLNSKPYVDMTTSVMADFGILVERQAYEWFQLQPGRYQAQATYAIESDASAASYFFALPAVCGGWVQVDGMRRDFRQGDIAFLDVLAEMGCRVEETETGIKVHGARELRGVDVDLRHISDTLMTLASVAPFAKTPTTIRGVAATRVKESDRVSATCTELARLGVQVEERHDGMTIQPCEAFQPSLIQTYNDHRMAMAFALVGLRVPGITIADPGCVSKTFPDYFQALESLRPA
jgi:3-phosphoshikimate 1-carboxyvinyltransferase